jgi:thiol-disulfide isomerase/thioredoxin
MNTRRNGIMVVILVVGIAMFLGNGCEEKTEEDSSDAETKTNTPTAPPADTGKPEPVAGAGKPEPVEGAGKPAPIADAVKPAPDENTIAEAHAFPSLTFTSVSGKEVNVADLTGKVVLIDFWATWCPPCVKAMPDLIATYKEYHDQGFEIVGISLDKDKSKLEKYVQDNGMAWQQYYDGLGWSNELAKRFGVRSIPHIVLIDKKGAVHFNTNYKKGKSPLHGDDLKQAVAALLK